MSAVEATLLFQRAATRLDEAAAALMQGRCREGLRAAKEALKLFIQSLSTLMGSPLHGVENPHYLAAVAEPLTGSRVFRLVTNAYLAENIYSDPCSALRLYVDACREVADRIRRLDPYLDIDRRTFRY
ncbi:MAG: hypothetical protein DRO39_02885 [Thermoprotei archaeon]|nr:MAG: hypothetical protein DRO39_02885 [Thermoprotei archaeon]